MADKTSFIMNTTSALNKDSKRSITDISSSATDSQIVALAEGINALTTNTLNSISKVTTKDLPMNLADRTIGTMSDFTLTKANFFDQTSSNSWCLLSVNNDSDAKYISLQPDGVAPYIKSNNTTIPVAITTVEIDGTTSYYVLSAGTQAGFEQDGYTWKAGKIVNQCNSDFF